MKKRVRLTEQDLHRIVRKSVSKILKEGSSDPQDYNKWEQIKEMVGPEKMVDDIFDYLDVDTIAKLIEWFNQDYEIFEDEYEEDIY